MEEKGALELGERRALPNYAPPSSPSSPSRAA